MKKEDSGTSNPLVGTKRQGLKSKSLVSKYRDPDGDKVPGTASNQQASNQGFCSSLETPGQYS
jgi:hypothetical protein